MERDFNVEIEYKHVPRFKPGSSASKVYLEEEGYVVLKETLTKTQAKQTLSLLWDYLESLGTGIDRHNPCLLYTSPSPRDGLLSRMPSSA